MPKLNTMKAGMMGAILALSATHASAQSAAQSPVQFVSPQIATTIEPQADYKLGPFDRISVQVYGEEKLSATKILVDASGQIVLPMIGVVTVGGKTASQVSDEVASRLGEKYLQSPHVNVTIDDAVSQRITVTGAVTESGVFTLKGRTTLMQAVAMAKGPDAKIGRLSHVVIIRQIDGRNARAVFDLNAISAGKMDDPQVFGGDAIFVETSEAKAFWRELLTALPSFAAFKYF